MFSQIIKDVGELVLTIVFIYIVVVWLVRHREYWAKQLKQQRLLLLWVIMLFVLLLKVSEDVIALESGPVDKAVLIWIHAMVPNTFTGFFRAVTLSASAKVIFPLLGILTALLFAVRWRFEATVMLSSVMANVLLIYLVKTLVGRERPMLWETEWYWGSSFPSGHTLTSATLATAICVCVARRWLPAKWPAIMLSIIWVLLVALSRLVLGVHWPTDVLASACAGVLIALVMDASLYIVRQRWKKYVSEHA